MTADNKLTHVHAVPPKADFHNEKPLGYKSVKLRHLQAVWALEYTRAITCTLKAL